MVRSIVLAEDNLEYCFFFERALKEVAPGTKFNAVHNGDYLMHLLESYLPDLLFVDLSMPCKNGVQCIQEIRDNKIYDLMPIIMFSVADDELTIQAAYGHGANLYIIKPGEYIQLKSFLQEALSMNWSDPKAITEKCFSKKKYVPFMLGSKT